MDTDTVVRMLPARTEKPRRRPKETCFQFGRHTRGILLARYGRHAMSCAVTDALLLATILGVAH